MTREEFRRHSDEYTKVTREAYESESHFYANKPRTPELGEKCKAAYEKFDKARKEYLESEKKK